MKKTIFLIVFCALLCFPVNAVAVARAENEPELISAEVDGQLESLDLENLNEVYSSLENSSGVDIKTKLSRLINGEDDLSAKSIINIVLSIIKDNYKSFLTFFLSIFAIGILSSLCKEISPSGKFSSASSLASTICYIVAVSMCTALVGGIIISYKKTINSLAIFAEAIFPILVGLVAGLGANRTSLILDPIITVFATGFINLINYFLFPLVICSLVLCIISRFNSKLTFGKLKSYIDSVFKWTIGAFFTIFLGTLSIKGITASSVDKLSIRSAKYAIKNYVPVVGGYFAESYELFRSGSILVKNSLGVVGIITIFSLALGMALKLIVAQLFAKLLSGALEPIGESKISGVLGDLSGILIKLFTIIACLFFMIFVLILVIISAGNLV